jgi:2Fe-2S ferredoxin
MTTVTYVQPDLTETTTQVPPGQSLMEGAVRANVAGILAECGGSMSCATCHVWVDAEAAAHFQAPSQEELDLVEYLPGSDERSRLACQLVVGPDTPGLRVRVADGG